MRAKTAVTIEDIREDLRALSARINQLPEHARRGTNLVRQRDERMRVAYKMGLRPAYIREDTGLNRSRIYRILNAEEGEKS